MSLSVTRRSVLRNLAVGSAAAVAATSIARPAPAADDPSPTQLKGRINHAVCRWCYGSISLDDLCKAAKAMGIKGIDLLGPNEWPTARKYGLTCSMAQGAGFGITRGFNRPENHDKLVESYEAIIPKVAEAGLENLICFSGNREGLDDEQGIKNCVKGLKRLAKLAEQKKVNLVMELLNSRHDHKDYQCDHTAWGAEVCRQVGSDRMKLLYDIYHLQIMEGDLITTIKQNIQYIAHFHTGGVPGRNEIDQTQEINYPAVMRAIAATGYKGFVAQEFLPRGKDPLKSLQQAVAICDV
jgi:hydroxypyruvate isomerase